MGGTHVFFLCLLSSFRLVCGLGLTLARVWLCCVLSSSAVGCMMLIYCLSCTQYTGALVGVGVLHRPRDCSSGLIVTVCVLHMDHYLVLYTVYWFTSWSFLVSFIGRVFVRPVSLLWFLYGVRITSWCYPFSSLFSMYVSVSQALMMWLLLCVLSVSLLGRV